MNNKNSSVTGRGGVGPGAPAARGGLLRVGACPPPVPSSTPAPAPRGWAPILPLALSLTAVAAVSWAQGRSSALRAGRVAQCWAAVARVVTCPEPPAGLRAASAMRSGARWETAAPTTAGPQRFAPRSTGRGRSSQGPGEQGTSVPSQGRKTASLVGSGGGGSVLDLEGRTSKGDGVARDARARVGLGRGARRKRPASPQPRCASLWAGEPNGHGCEKSR